MNLEQWRAAQREAARETETTFNIRGLPVRVQKIEIHNLALEGSIPLPLLATLEKSGGKLGEMTTDQMQGVDRMARTVVKAAAVEPRVADKPSKDSMGVDELTAAERFEIFSWCLSGVRALEAFRTGSRSDNGAVADEPDIQRETVADAQYP
jgi:hypothetical protein